MAGMGLFSTNGLWHGVISQSQGVHYLGQRWGAESTNEIMNSQ